MKPLNLDKVESKSGSGDFHDIEPGGYICRIMMVEDFPEKEYLRVDMDIATGEYKDYYKDLAARAGFWGCTQYWSYKENNKSYFKGNIDAVEKSNTDFRFNDQREKDLEGKLVGAVFGEEEYRSKNGDIRCSVRPRYVCSASRIMDHKYKIPKKKEYDPKKDKRNRPAGGGGDYLSPLMKDTGNDLDTWAAGQKLPWE